MREHGPVPPSIQVQPETSAPDRARGCRSSAARSKASAAAARSAARPAWMEARIAIIRPSVVFEERFRIVDSVADERVSDERVDASSLVWRQLRGESLADTVVIGLDALGGSAAANEMCRAKTGDERPRVPCET